MPCWAQPRLRAVHRGGRNVGVSKGKIEGTSRAVLERGSDVDVGQQFVRKLVIRMSCSQMAEVGVGGLAGRSSGGSGVAIGSRNER
jgi:hypothetical protein